MVEGLRGRGWGHSKQQLLRTVSSPLRFLRALWEGGERRPEKQF